MGNKGKVLVLLSGGLDSTLVVNIMLQRGFTVAAVNYSTPFCLCDKCAVESVADSTGITVHRVNLGSEFLNILSDPPHGYGSQMNPCIDCRILMLRHAKKLAQQIGAIGIVTGEVLDERPFSQRQNTLKLIERAADLEGQTLRPLSAKLLPESDLEKTGLVNRHTLYSIRGRRRQPQIHLAESMGITDYPCPAGGCLLTDPNFAKRLKDLLKNEETLSLTSIALIKIGRHFRMNGQKIIVGRNETENRRLHAIALQEQRPYIEVSNYMGPITLLEHNPSESILKIASAITVRYSDAPTKVDIEVKLTGSKPGTLHVQASDIETIEQLRIK
jgi:tRNA U34 2-thiouridine synthase MnmA/TrmU